MSTPDAPSRADRGYSHGELIADATVHAAAIVAGVIGFSVLFQKIAMRGAVGDGVAMAVYAAGFFLLFGFSCAYNMAPPSPAKTTLRRFDHASIYLMIGGTYTALLSQARASLSVVALAVAVWIAALAGASLKLFLPGRFDRFSVRLYLALGWSAVFAHQAAGQRPAGRHARLCRRRRRDLFGRRRLLPVGEPQVPERDLARLRHGRRGAASSPACCRRSDGEARRRRIRPGSPLAGDSGPGARRVYPATSSARRPVSVRPYSSTASTTTR